MHEQKFTLLTETRKMMEIIPHFDYPNNIFEEYKTGEYL
jgi:hypothetical protein